jgi:hypothetical protein
MRFLCVFLLACFLETVGKAEVLYTFDYDAVTGPVQSFTFSFTAPDFVTNGSSPAFTPFTPTDGTNSWTITQDLVTGGCFLFGTPFAGLGLPPFTCSVGVGGPGNNQGGFYWDFDANGDLPSAVGTYGGAGFGGAFDTPDGSFEYIGPITQLTQNTGTMTLTITQTPVPDPSTLSLTMISLLALGGTLAKRVRQAGL